MMAMLRMLEPKVVVLSEADKDLCYHFTMARLVSTVLLNVVLASAGQAAWRISRRQWERFAAPDQFASRISCPDAERSTGMEPSLHCCHDNRCSRFEEAVVPGESP